MSDCAGHRWVRMPQLNFTLDFTCTRCGDYLAMKIPRGDAGKPFTELSQAIGVSVAETYGGRYIGSLEMMND
jgi:hypothetical protein